MVLDKNFVDGFIQDKNILYVPIISSINRETGLYNLDSDGNVVRFITFFTHHNTFRNITIILPKGVESHTLINRFSNSSDKIHISCIDNKTYFGEHAGDQRSDEGITERMANYIMYLLGHGQTDTIIFESQGLGNELIYRYYDKLQPKVVDFIYWCPVCKIDENHTRNFLEGYEDLNEYLFEKSDFSIVESPKQVEKYSKNYAIYPYYQMIDRDIKIFDYSPNVMLKNNIENNLLSSSTVFYLPYRLTDGGYKVDKVISYINKISDDLHKERRSIVVFYTDPNNSGYMNKIKSKFNKDIVLLQIDTSRNTHFTMLSCPDVIVPYFEDLDFINHALLWEMMDDKGSKCNFCVTSEQWKANPYNLNSCSRCFYIDINKL